MSMPHPGQLFQKLTIELGVKSKGKFTLTLGRKKSMSSGCQTGVCSQVMLSVQAFARF